jgi:hypothetical protein
MEESSGVSKTISFEQLVDLREYTEKLAQLLHQQLKTYLEILRPLFAPRRVLGKYAGAKETVTGADKLFADLKDQYARVCGKPFALLPELDEKPLSEVENRLELFAWEYTHTARTDRDTKTMTMTSPVRWVLIYNFGLTLSQLRQSLAGDGERRPEVIQQFVVNALVMKSVLDRFPGITRLLTDLRYHVQCEPVPGFGELPLVTISSCLTSFRPADDLILTAARFSGVAAFIELIDIDSVHELSDPFKRRLEDMLH